MRNFPYSHINVKDDRGKTLLRHAVDHRASTIVRHLLGRGADPNIPDNHGITPLLSISFHQNNQNTSSDHLDGINCEVARELIMGGANVHCNSGEGQTFFYYAIRHNKRCYIELLLEFNIPLTIDSVVLLPFHVAAIHGSLDVARCLISNGSDGLDINGRDCFESTPLHYAVKYPEMVELLLSHGADVNAKDMFGITPLYAAVSKSHNVESVRLLLNHGADMNFKCKDNLIDSEFTAKEAALDLNLTDMVRLMEEYEITLDIKTPESFMNEQG